MTRWQTPLWLCAIVVASSSVPASATWQFFDRSNGLPANSVSAISQDREEALWIGTYGGLARYDGITWRTYRSSDGLPSDYVTAVFCDPSGPIWVGTPQGLARFDGTSWRTFTSADGLPTNTITCIAKDAQGRIWVGTDDREFFTGLGGVARFDGTGWQAFTTADGLPSNSVNAIECTRSGEVWVGTNGGAGRYDGVVWTPEPEAGFQIFDIHEDRQGGVWFASGGLALLTGSSWRHLGFADGLPSSLRAIGEDQDGGIWAGGDDAGLFLFDGTRWRQTALTDPAPGYLTTIISDRAGNLWLGSLYGLGRYDRSRWERIEVLENDVNCALVDAAGNVWIGMEGAGASRFTGDTWINSLPGNSVRGIAQAPDGALWFATWGLGVARLEDSTLVRFTSNEGLPSDYMDALAVDHLGRVWCGGAQGLARYDGTSWLAFSATDDNRLSLVLAIEEDKAGNIWVGTGDQGALKFDGVGWTQYTADGSGSLGSNEVQSIYCDRSGAVWFGTDGGGVSRLVGTTWTLYTTANGLASMDDPRAITQDRSGAIWVAANGGASRFDGERWVAFAQVTGLQNYSDMSDIVEDASGALWFTSASAGVTRYDPDRVAPQTVLVSRPPSVSSGRQQNSTALTAFGEATGIEYSNRLDGAPWSPWSVSGLWSASGLSDGTHSVEIRARDWLGNIDLTPALATFEVDATAPAPFISSPVAGFVRGLVTVQGTTWDSRFSIATLTFRGSSSESTVYVFDSVLQGDLAVWDTNLFPDGEYQVILTVYDTLGLVGTSTRSVTVDNQFPPAEQTSPARIVANLGGDVYTTNDEVHLYFPPRAFPEDAIVIVRAGPSMALPDSIPVGGKVELRSVELDYAPPGITLQKSVLLEFAYTGLADRAVPLAIYYSAAAGVDPWTRIGGTRDNRSGRVAASVNARGTYALFAESAFPEGSSSLSAISFAPRVFSPTSGFPAAEAAISFTLGRAATATVRIYNRAGRLVREVSSGQELGPGVNTIRWDGRDRDGAIVADGLYIVAVQALGKTERGALAVVH